VTLSSLCFKPREDYPDSSVQQLSSYLRNHPSGDLTTYLAWNIAQFGPESQRTYHATVQCELFQSKLRNYPLICRSRWERNRPRERDSDQRCQERSCHVCPGIPPHPWPRNEGRVFSWEVSMIPREILEGSAVQFPQVPRKAFKLVWTGCFELSRLRSTPTHLCMGTTTSLNPASVKEVTEASQYSTSYGTSRNFGDYSGPANARVAVCILVQIMN
jgi:hypothetical protein